MEYLNCAKNCGKPWGFKEDSGVWNMYALLWKSKLNQRLDMRECFEVLLLLGEKKNNRTLFRFEKDDKMDVIKEDDQNPKVLDLCFQKLLFTAERDI